MFKYLENLKKIVFEVIKQIPTTCSFMLLNFTFKKICNYTLYILRLS